MRIIRVVPFLDFGGLERRVFLTAIGFQKYSDLELEIFVLGSQGKTSGELFRLGIHPKHFNSKIRIPNLKLIYILYRQFRLFQPDVVHTSSAEANFHGLIAAWLAGVPVRIGEEIGFPNHDWKWRIIFRKVYSLATKVIAISEAVKNRIVKLKEVKADKVEVVYNPVFIKEKKGRRTLGYSDAFVFVTTCRLVPVKNLDTLIAVFNDLVQDELGEELKLWIIGEGTERAKLEKLVNESRLNGKVVFWGFQENIRPYLEAADAFVLPSFSEGFSISLVEAMLCGLPCIVTNQGGPSEIIEDQSTGFLINPNDPRQIKNTMQHLIQISSQDRIQMGNQAKQATSKYSIENHVKRLLEVYST
ncbi:glycosyltransferase [Algoriphagus halophytocola]|uniref:Glycosyltransferase n=1 Tax=Algoriphagus halophytocola TaxID=2991499 RepID=A0ABY6MNF8_9BACT|nr:glycosyltransferase [Algoriphagus sp. TR-M5]UZD23932.1 glycosyltransferase [Algoriphagus sp. TR-M5]